MFNKKSKYKNIFIITFFSVFFLICSSVIQAKSISEDIELSIAELNQTNFEEDISHVRLEVDISKDFESIESDADLMDASSEVWSKVSELIAEQIEADKVEIKEFKISRWLDGKRFSVEVNLDSLLKALNKANNKQSNTSINLESLMGMFIGQAYAQRSTLSNTYNFELGQAVYDFASGVVDGVSSGLLNDAMLAAATAFVAPVLPALIAHPILGPILNGLMLVMLGKDAYTFVKYLWNGQYKKAGFHLGQLSKRLLMSRAIVKNINSPNQPKLSGGKSNKVKNEGNVHSEGWMMKSLRKQVKDLEEKIKIRKQEQSIQNSDITPHII